MIVEISILKFSVCLLIRRLPSFGIRGSSGYAYAAAFPR